MLKLVEIGSKLQKREFCHFVYNVYENNSCYKDQFNHSVQYFLYGKKGFIRQCQLLPVAIYAKQEMVARCLFILHPSLPKTLQLGFFEALPNQQQSVNLILNKAEIVARQWQAKRIVIGLNGHLAYGVGFLTSHHDLPNSFDAIYTQPYYPDYFRQHHLKEYTLSTYQYQLEQARFNEQSVQSIYSQFSFRTINLKNFDQEIKILSGLFNDTLLHTRFYFKLTSHEYKELMQPLLPILNNENIIFVQHQGQDIGFIFWHPDYHELLHSGKNRVFPFLLKYLFKKNAIKNFKINTIGVLPEYWHSGATTGLVYEAYQQVKNQYNSGESNFIWDNNLNSAGTSIRFTGQPFKRYVLFEKSLVTSQNIE